jgi:plasmid stabilization system protein ParE
VAATVVYSAQALDDIERALESLSVADGQLAQDSALAIRTAVEALAPHPLIGRRIEGDLRELIISYGRTGYVALYRFDLRRDEVRLLALRPQRDVGYVP